MGKKNRKKQEKQAIEQGKPAIEKVFAGPQPKISIGNRNRLKIVICAILVFIASFAVYFNTLKGDFIWDDEYLILNNSQIKDFKHLPNIFKTYVGYGSENINNFYRPIQELSNMIDYSLWGEYPMGFHLTNTILHSLVSLMVFLFLFYILGNYLPALIGALFYAVHPVHTEAIAYIAGRADSLYSFFMLLSMVFFIRFVKRYENYGRKMYLYFLSIVFFALSILSKEIVIIFPAILIIYLVYFNKGRRGYGRLKWAWVPYGVISVIYGFLRSTVLSFSDIAPRSAFIKIPLIFRLMTFFKSIVVYFKLLFFPVGLHMERSIPISKTMFEAQGIFALIVVIALIYLAVKTFRTNKVVSFAILWFFANLFPVSNIVPINSFLAEHWIYMASVGIFLVLGYYCSRAITGTFKDNLFYRNIFIVILAVFFCMYCKMTIDRNVDWKDEISFFNSTLKYHPRNARLYLNLGNTYYEKKEIDKAIEQYEKAISINKNYAVAYGNIGSAYLHRRQPKKAEEYLVKAIAIKHNYPIAHYNLGIIYFEQKNYEKAVSELNTAVNQLPQLYQAWNMLGRTYLKLGKSSEAKEAFGRSLNIMPGQPKIMSMYNKFK